MGDDGKEVNLETFGMSEMILEQFVYCHECLGGSSVASAVFLHYDTF